MIVSRAAFLKFCGAALVGSSLPRWAFPGDSPSSSAPAAAGAGSAARFQPHIGSPFTVHGTGHRIRLSSIDESFASPGIEQFALNFSAPAGSPLEHGTYTLRHASLGSIEMFITPVGAPGSAATYQACFSRIVETRNGRG